MAVKPAKPERKKTLRVDSASRLPETGKSSRTATLRPPVSRPSGSRPPSGRPSNGGSARPASRSNRPRPPRPEPSQPEITVRRAPAGRETLAAIEEELAREAPIAIRPKLDTLDYEDRPAPPTSSRPPHGSSPEVITIGEGTIGRNTQAAIDEALATDRVRAAGGVCAAPLSTVQPMARSTPQPAQIFEISTFVIEGDEIFSKASETSRREFVAQRLLHRLPALSMNEVVRIDVSRGAAANTAILRIWSKVGSPRAR